MSPAGAGSVPALCKTASGVALGLLLAELGRRAEAKIIVWNFFQDPGTGEYRVPPTPYAEHHPNLMLDQLRTDYIDRLEA